MKLFFIFLISVFASQTVFAEKVSINVLTCEPEWAALVIALGGEHVNVNSATTYLQDPHHIQARPSLIAKARSADLLICSGAGLEEGWLPLLLQKSSNAKIQKGQPAYFMASEKVQLLGKVSRVDRADGDVHGLGNPHIHLNPYLVLKVANALTQELSRIDAEHQKDFENNYQKFDKKIQTALSQWTERIAALKNKKAIVHHDSWIYLFDWLGIENQGSLEPKPGLPPSTAHLVGLLDTVKQQPIDFILYSSYQDGKAAEWLSNRSTIPAIKLPYSVDDWQSENALINWYDSLLSLLLEASSSATSETLGSAQ